MFTSALQTRDSKMCVLTGVYRRRVGVVDSAEFWLDLMSTQPCNVRLLTTRRWIFSTKSPDRYSDGRLQPTVLSQVSYGPVWCSGNCCRIRPGSVAEKLDSLWRPSALAWQQVVGRGAQSQETPDYDIPIYSQSKHCDVTAQVSQKDCSDPVIYGLTETVVRRYPRRVTRQRK